MKIALLADIHGNVDALRAVIKAASAENVDHYIIAGDFIGYYYRSAQVLEELEEVKIIAIRGNHEDLYRSWIEKPETRAGIVEKYGSSFEKLQNLKLDKLLNLPEQKEFTVLNKEVLLCHGSPWGHDEYIYPDCSEDKIQKLYSYKKDIIVFGHSHYQLLWERNDQIVINPGSVGQPRDYIPGACWALWDVKENKITLRREKYDCSRTILDCKEHDPDFYYLQKILLRTKNNPLN